MLSSALRRCVQRAGRPSAALLRLPRPLSSSSAAASSAGGEGRELVAVGERAVTPFHASDGQQTKEEEQNPYVDSEWSDIIDEWVDTLHLDKWYVAAPFGVFIGAHLLRMDVVLFNGNILYAGAFAFTLALMREAAKDGAMDFFNEQRDKIRSDLHEAHDSAVVGMKKGMEQMQDLSHFAADAYGVGRALAEARVQDAETAARVEQDAVSAFYQRKVDTMLALEGSTMQASKDVMLESVGNTVMEGFTSDKQARDKALTAAINVLQSDNAKRGQDVVGEAFQSALAQYREGYNEEKDPVIVKLNADLAAVAAEPYQSSSH